MGTSGLRQANVNVQRLGRFAAMSGGEPSVSIGTAFNGGARTPDRMTSRAQYGNITVARPFDPRRDRENITRCNDWIKRGVLFYIVKLDTDGNDVPIARGTTWHDCLLVRVGEPVYDENADAAPQMWDLEFAPASRTP